MERQTESRNPRARNLSKMPTRQILELINDEDATIAAAVRAAIPQIERAVDLIVPALARTRGSDRAGTPSMSSSSGSQRPPAMS